MSKIEKASLCRGDLWAPWLHLLRFAGTRIYCLVRVLKRPLQAGISSRLVPRDRSVGKQDGAKDVKLTVSYSPLREALEHRWSSTPRRQTKSLNPAAVFIILGKNTELPCLMTRADIYRNSFVGIPKYSPGSSPRRHQIRRRTRICSKYSHCESRGQQGCVPRDFSRARRVSGAFISSCQKSIFKIISQVDCDDCDTRVCTRLRGRRRNACARYLEGARCARSTIGQLLHVRWEHWGRECSPHEHEVM